MTNIGASAEVAQRQMFAATNKAKNNIYALQKQVQNERKVNNYVDLTNIGGVMETMTTQASLKRADTYKKIHATYENRLQTTIDVVTNIIDIAGEVRDFLMLKKSASSSTLPTDIKANNYLDTIAPLLNKNTEGRYLFSGSKTNIPPVITPLSTQNPNLDVTLSIPNTSYYKGDSAILTYQANDGNTIQYGVCANEPGFRDIIASLFLAIKAENLGRPDLLNKAIDLTTTAIDELMQTQTRLRTASGQAELVRKEQVKLEATIKEREESLLGTDYIETVNAISKLMSERSALEASYKGFNIINQMDLSQHIN